MESRRAGGSNYGYESFEYMNESKSGHEYFEDKIRNCLYTKKGKEVTWTNFRGCSTARQSIGAYKWPGMYGLLECVEGKVSEW